MAIETALDPVEDLIAEAKRVLPGGSFGNLPAEVVIRAGKAGHVWDEHGKEYVDFLLGSGPMFIGHGHPEVTAAVQSQLPHGSTYFGNNRHGIALASAIVDAVPCAEQVRFVCTGTEADLYAMRAQSGPTLVMNGMVDSLVAKPGHFEPFFADLRDRIAAITGSRTNLPETIFFPDVGHRPSWVTRPAALWLNHQLHFPNWTDAQIEIGRAHV